MASLVFSSMLAMSSAEPAAPEAEPVALSLKYAAPAGCPSEADFIAWVERDLGAPVILQPEATVAIRTSITTTRERTLVLTFEVVDGDGTTLATELADAR